MNNQNNIQYFEQGIDLKELFIVFWKRKKIIISLTLLCAILTGILSMFVLSPVYKTKINIVISMPEKYSTRYGEYTLPITSNEQYINLITSNDVLQNTIIDMGYNKNETLEDIKEKISIGSNNSNTGVQNSFEVTVSAESPEESFKLAQYLFSNYIEFMDVMIKDRAIGYFDNYFNIEIKTQENNLVLVKETLAKNEELLTETPRLISKGEANLEIQSTLTDDTDYVIPVDTINPNYIKIENDIVSNKQAINSINNSINMNKKYIEEIELERQAITKYYETGRAEKLDSTITGIIESSIYLPSQPVAPTEKSSPNNLINTFAGAVIGCIIGIMTALIKEYWFKESL